MARRRRTRRSGNSKRGRRATSHLTLGATVPGSGIVVEHGSGLLNFSIANGSNSGNLDLNLQALSVGIPRFAQLMEAYQLFRFRRFVMKFPPQIPQLASELWSAAYTQGDATIGGTITTASLLSCPASFFTSGVCTIPQLLRLGPEQLLTEGQSRWYRTQISAAVETWEEQQGTVFVALSVNATANRDIFAHVEYDLELCSQVAPPLIPSAREPHLTPSYIDFMYSKIMERHSQVLSLPIVRT